MTQNQINFAAHKEQQRSNLAREAETERSNRAKENETYRSNVAQEALGYARLGEDSRHNHATEGIQLFNLYETQRSNLAREGETNRANLAKEKENERHNKQQESIDYAKVFETARANNAKEQLARDQAMSDLGYASYYTASQSGAGFGSKLFGGVGMAVDYITDLIPMKGSIRINT